MRRRNVRVKLGGSVKAFSNPWTSARYSEVVNARAEKRSAVIRNNAVNPNVSARKNAEEFAVVKGVADAAETAVVPSVAARKVLAKRNARANATVKRPTRHPHVREPVVASGPLEQGVSLPVPSSTGVARSDMLRATLTTCN